MAADVALPLQTNRFGVMRAKAVATTPKTRGSPSIARARYNSSQSSQPQSILRKPSSRFSRNDRSKASSRTPSAYSKTSSGYSSPRVTGNNKYRGSTGNSRRRQQLKNRSKPPGREAPGAPSKVRIANPSSARPSTPTFSPRTDTKGTAKVLVRPHTPPNIDEEKTFNTGTSEYRAPTELDLGEQRERRDSTSSNFSYSADEQNRLSQTTPDQLVWKTSALCNRLPKISSRPRIAQSPSKRKQTWPRLPTTKDMQERLEPINKEIERNLAYMRAVMDGRPYAGVQAKPEDTKAFLKPLSTTNLLPNLLSHLGDITHRASQDLLILFDCMVQKIKSTVLAEYLKRNRNIFPNLVDALQYTGISSTAANILKSMIKVKEGWRVLMNTHTKLVYKLFDIVQSPDFQTASAALTIVQLLLSHPMGKDKPPWASAWILRNYDTVIPIYHKKIVKGANYVNRRMGLKVLGEILTDSGNQELLMRYIGERKNLIMMMTLLRDKQNAVKYEAFHIFKLFVANPHKQEAIVKILMVNRKKLIRFLGNFLMKRDTKDEMFVVEKHTLIDILEKMEDKYGEKKHAPTPSTVFDLGARSVDLKYNDPMIISANRKMPSIEVPQNDAKPQASRRISESVYIDIHKRIMSVDFPEVPDMFEDVDRKT